MKQEGQLGRKKASLVVLLAQQHKEHLLAVARNDYLHVNQQHTSISKMLNKVLKLYKLQLEEIFFCDVVYQMREGSGGGSEDMAPTLLVVTSDLLLSFSGDISDLKHTSSIHIHDVTMVIENFFKKKIVVKYQREKRKEKKDRKGEGEEGEEGEEESVMYVAKSNKLHVKLAKILQHVHETHPSVTFTKLQENDIREGLSSMFQEFDADGSESIDYLELEQLLNVICDRGRSGVHLDAPFSTDDVQVVVSSFDTDGSGTVEEAEFVDWVLAGMATSLVERKILAGKTSVAAKLEIFLTSISCECSSVWSVKHGTHARKEREEATKEEEEEEEEKEEKERGKDEDEEEEEEVLFMTARDVPPLLKDPLNEEQILRNDLHEIFSQYDFTNGGMNPKAFGSLLKSLKLTDTFKEQEISEVFQLFDVDSNGLVSEDELITWVREEK